jgi:CheY-like chemotaxis protein
MATIDKPAEGQDNKQTGLQSKAEQYTVFMVEDDTDDRRQAVQELRKSSHIYAVHCFESGDQMIEYFVSEGYYSGNLMRLMPTLILLDQHIPGSSGTEILQKLKSHPATADFPVIILTGDVSDQLALKAHRFKANAFLTKPLKLEDLQEVISTGWGWPGHDVP